MSRQRISIDTSEKSALKLGNLPRLNVKQDIARQKTQNFTVFYRRFYGSALCCAISLLVTEQLSTNQLKFKLGIFANLKEFFLTVVCFDGYELVQVES